MKLSTPWDRKIPFVGFTPTRELSRLGFQREYKESKLELADVDGLAIGLPSHPHQIGRRLAIAQAVATILMQVGSDILQVRSEVARSVPLHNEVPEELDTTDYSVSEH